MEEQAMVNEAKPVNPSLENQLEKSGQMAIVEARSMVIENKQDYEQAGKFLVEIKTVRSRSRTIGRLPRRRRRQHISLLLTAKKRCLSP